MKVVFAGTPEYAATALAALHAAGHEIVLVLTQPDRPAGRGLQLHASAVKHFAVQHHIPILQPRSLRLDGKFPDDARAAHEFLQNTQHDVMVVAAYGLILPASMLSIPPHGCLNIHASLLPRWRGAAPIHRALEAGDSETGITIMQMDEGLDTGATLAMHSIPITAQDNQASLHDKLTLLGARMIVDALQNLSGGTLNATPQPQQGMTYASKVSKQEAQLDFTQSAVTLQRKIRAFNPTPGAFAVLRGVAIKLWDAELVAGSISARPGQIILKEHAVIVVCGTGALRLITLQKPGGKQMATAEFLKGFPFNDGDCFDEVLHNVSVLGPVSRKGFVE